MKKPLKLLKNKKIYLTIFISNIILMTIVIFVLSFTLSISFKEILTDKIYESQKDSLVEMNYSLDYICESVKTFTLQLYFDSDISKLRNLSSLDYYEVNTAFNRLSMYGAIIPYLKSIYVYNNMMDKYYVSTPYGPTRLYSTDEFYDEALKGMITSAEGYRQLYPMKREIPMIDSHSNIEYIDGFTYIFSNQNVGNKLGEGGVIVNLSESWMKNMVGRHDSEFQGNTYIVDTQGNVLIDSKSESRPILADIYFTGILNSGEKYGYFVNDDLAEQSLIIYSRYEPLEWTIVRVIKLNSIMKEITQVRSKIVLISCIILLIGILIALFVVKRIYKPIDLIMSKLSVFEKEKDKKVNAERRQIIKDFILGKTPLEEEIAPIMESLGVSENLMPNFLVAYIMIDNYALFKSAYDTKERELLKYAMLDKASGSIGAYFANEGVDLGDDHIVTIISVSNERQELYKEDLELLLIKIQDLISRELKISISVIISELGRDFEEIPQLYNQARKLSFDRFFYNHKCILYYTDEKKKKYSDYGYPIQLEKKLVDELFSGNLEKVWQLYNRIVDDSLDYSYYTVRLTILHIAFSIYSSLHIMEENLGISFEFNFENFITNIERIECLVDINKYFESFFASISDVLKTKTDLKHKELSESVTKIVNDNYSDINLSIEYIADKMNMSSAYLGRLYSKTKSRSIVDFINQVRIEKAKELLISTKYKISEIPDIVGYSSIQHFYRTFKKAVGVTPNEYRNSRE